MNIKINLCTSIMLWYQVSQYSYFKRDKTVTAVQIKSNRANAKISSTWNLECHFLCPNEHEEKNPLSNAYSSKAP